MFGNETIQHVGLECLLILCVRLPKYAFAGLQVFCYCDSPDFQIYTLKLEYLATNDVVCVGFEWLLASDVSTAEIQQVPQHIPQAYVQVGMALLLTTFRK